MLDPNTKLSALSTAEFDVNLTKMKELMDREKANPGSLVSAIQQRIEQNPAAGAQTRPAMAQTEVPGQAGGHASGSASKSEK